MAFALYFMLFGILVVCPETDGTDVTWKEPSPILTVQESDSDLVFHKNRTRLILGTIDASLSWHFILSSDLTLNSVTIKLGTVGIAVVNGQKQEVLENFRDKYAINWIPNQRITLVIFNVTTEHNATFVCEVGATKNFISIWRSRVQVDIVAPPSNIVTSSDQTINATDKLTLNCSADGIPKPTISWKRVFDNTPVTMPLTIIRGKNEEIFRCTADNGVGEPLTKNVSIIILFSPKVSLASKFFVDRGDTAPLICQVEGNPKPSISWSSCDLLNVPCDKQYLNVSNVQTARTNFNCTATNALGVDSASTVLLIGGYNIYLKLIVDEKCEKKASVWQTLQNEFDKVFTDTHSYSGAELTASSCGSLIFDVVLKFSTEVAEDDTIAIIQNAIVNGKLGELRVNISSIIGIPPAEQTSTAAPTSTPRISDDNTGLIIGIVLGSVAFVALIVFIIWCVRKKKCCSETKEVSDNTDSAQGRKGKGPSGADEVAYASTSMLPHSKRPVEKASQSTGQALPMYAQVDKTKKTSNKGGAAQRQRQPGELQYAEVEHVTSGRSLPRKSSSEPIKPSNEEIVYADLV